MRAWIVAMVLAVASCTGDNPMALDEDAGADAGADLVVTFADVDLAELAPDLAGELAPDLAELPDLVRLPDLATQPDLFTPAEACKEAGCQRCVNGARRCWKGVWDGRTCSCPQIGGLIEVVCPPWKTVPCPS